MKTLHGDVFGDDSLKPHAYMKGHKPGMGHKSTGKLSVGCGGLNCPCCTKLPPNELKIKERRMNRRKNKQNIKKEID